VHRSWLCRRLEWRQRLNPSHHSGAESASPARLLLYDASPRRLADLAKLSAPLSLGALALTVCGRFDGAFRARSWAEAFGWLLFVGSRRPLEEVQVWSHGRWGEARLEYDPLTVDCFARSHALYPILSRVRRVLEGGALVWFRTCATFGALSGREFARVAAEALGCCVAGHTYDIGLWQSGLHTLAPGARPDWDVWEGLNLGTPQLPLRARESGPTEPRTVTALQMGIPRTCGVHPSPGRPRAAVPDATRDRLLVASPEAMRGWKLQK
jgi:hypothetical protein